MVLTTRRISRLSYLLSTDPEFEFEVKELKPVVSIKPIGDKISVKFSQFIEEFKK